MRWRVPPATAAILGVVLATRLAQIAVPGWYGALARHPGAPWWRAVTALFAYDDGWAQILFIMLGALILGIASETRLGSRLWLTIFVVAGLAGQAFALAWQPEGAGSSVAVAGLVGAFAAHLLLAPNLPRQARVGTFVILLGAVALSAGGDIHGPPVLVGFAIAALSLAR